MAFDYKKEYKAFYLPAAKPEIITIPPMNYIAVRGKGNPNAEGGEYKKAVGMLYSVAYTLKMSPKAGHQIEGFFDYVVPPLEGLWWSEDGGGIDYSRKDSFCWISMIRIPDFVTEAEAEWAKESARAKKKLDCSALSIFHYDEGCTVQLMHIGPYDNEPASIALMEQHCASLGYVDDFTGSRFHHEIYISDPNKCAADRLKTVIRHPVRKL